MHTFSRTLEYIFSNNTINSHTHLVIFICLLPFMLFVYIKIAYIYIKERNIFKRKNDELLSWPTVDGIVNRSEVGVGVIPGEAGGPFTYFAIKYTYYVNDNVFHSYNFKPIEPLGDPEDVCNKLVSEYPSGKKVKVYYNPENHKEAYLQKSNKNEISRAAAYPYFFYYILLFIGMAGTWYGSKVPAELFIVISIWILVYKNLLWIEKKVIEFV